MPGRRVRAQLLDGAADQLVDEVFHVTEEAGSSPPGGARAGQVPVLWIAILLCKRRTPAVCAAQQ